MKKEMFKKYIEECGGVEILAQCREELMELVCAIDDVIELEAKVDLVEVSEEEIFKKVTKMVILMSETIS